MTCSRRLAQVCLVAAILPCADTKATNYPFRLDAEQRGASHYLVATNDGYAPVTAKIEVTGSNIVGIETWPLVTVIPARSTVSVGQISPASSSAGYRFKFRYFIQIGVIHARVSPETTYRLPYPDGHGYGVLQAPGGPVTTHTDRRSAYAIDFDLPEGTPVVAARDGVVVEVVTGHTFGRLDPALKGMDNHVAIVHADGTVSEYVHLQSGPYVVHPGQKVTAGTVLGYSGNTGYSSGPHLHFAVVKPTLGTDGKLGAESIPVWFRFFDGGTPQSVVAGTLAYAGIRLQDSDHATAAGTTKQEPVRDPPPSLQEAHTRIEVKAVESQGDNTTARASDPVPQAEPSRRARVFFVLPLGVADVPGWVWASAALGLWMVIAALARLLTRGSPTRRTEPRIGGRVSDE